MSKKPASLTSDLLARKGEAEPSSIDPRARMSLFAGPDYSPMGGGSSSDDEERPRPPEPEIIYTAEDSAQGGGGTRLVIGAIIGAIVIGGVLLTLSGKNEKAVAPVSSNLAAQQPAPQAATPGWTPSPQSIAPTTTAPEAQAPAPQAPAAEAPVAAAPAPGTSAPAAPEALQPAAPATAPQPAPEAAQTAPEATQPSGTAEQPALRPGSETPPVVAAPVEEAPATPAAEAPAPAAAKPAKVAAKGAYVIQISALKDEKSAKTAWRSLQKRFPSVLSGHALDIEKADLGAKGTWYRVRAAGFASKDAAAGACAKLKASGQACMVKKR